MVRGSPARNTWKIHCHGATSLPNSYGCALGYGLDRIGDRTDNYMDATAHIPGADDIHFKMYKINPPSKGITSRWTV